MPVIETSFRVSRALLEGLAASRERRKIPARAGKLCVGCRGRFHLRAFAVLAPLLHGARHTGGALGDDRSEDSGGGLEMALAQPCYPIQVAHGHVAARSRCVDYILVPTCLKADMGPEGTGTATLPVEPDRCVRAPHPAAAAGTASAMFLIPRLTSSLAASR